MKKLFFMMISLLLIGAAANAQDTTPQRDQTKSQTQKRDRIHQEEHLMYMDGKLYRWQNGERVQVQSQVQLRNGGVANPDGTYQLQNQERMQLRNGECLDMDGNRYKSQKRFNKHRMMTHQQIQQSHQRAMHQQQRGMQKQQGNSNRQSGRRG